ncbi:MAG: hydrogenase formation protein HypD [Chloroflexota bacterium]|nr:hydrogenase formation protein HypD [Chloroflexota bacterium]
MKYIDEYRDPELAKALVGRIAGLSRRPVRLMEFCGGHTVTIMRHGIRQLLPPTVEMLSGPGCPVCVTSNQDLDKAIALAGEPGVIVATFGDMLKVPGSRSSLSQARADGADVRVVYSTMDALELARKNRGRHVCFLGVGFETTAPTVAASVLKAREGGLANYSVLSLHKLCPPVIRALIESGEVRLDGLICPGHVSAIIGAQAWEFAATDYGLACVVSGFEPLDVLQCIAMLVEQLEQGQPTVDVAYRRGVSAEGNLRAQEVMYTVFEPSAASWRGMGTVPGSGLALKEEFAPFDAERVFEIDPGPTVEAAGCICGDILRGVSAPTDCPLFGGACTPGHPVGPCMVSSEGSCASYYHYGTV